LSAQNYSILLKFVIFSVVIPELICKQVLDQMFMVIWSASVYMF